MSTTKFKTFKVVFLTRKMQQLIRLLSLVISLWCVKRFIKFIFELVFCILSFFSSGIHMDFETTLKTLTTLVDEMERGGLSLEDALKRF